MTRLGVNIDHVATLRQARKEGRPDPVQAAVEVVRAGANGITAHLREDRRHIQDSDIIRLKKILKVPLNMEMAVAPEIVAIAARVKPQWACFVPERRVEVTTEGGLNVVKGKKEIAAAIRRLHKVETKVSLFIEPNLEMVKAAAEVEADAIEIHTGTFARVFKKKGPALKRECERIQAASEAAEDLGLLVNAGHGLDYDNVPTLLKLYQFHELNIGFSIIARSVYTGLAVAVKEMKKVVEIACAAS